MRRDEKVRWHVPQVMSFFMLLAGLSATVIMWLLADSGGMSWMPTPSFFVLCTVLLASLASLSVWRRPRPWLVVTTLGLMLVCLPAAASLDMPQVSEMSLAGLLVAGAILAGATVAGSHRAGRRVPTKVLVVMGLCLVALTGALAMSACAGLYGADEWFVEEASPAGRWVALGYRSNMGATVSGWTEVVVRRERWHLMRQQRTVFEKASVVDPSVSWQDDDTLRISGKTVDLRD